MLRILIVDDHVFVREGLSLLLNMQPDMKVVAEAVNGQEGIEAYRQHRPDVVLMDVRMPVMDGITATQALVAEFPEAVVVLLSASISEDILPLLTRSGAKNYIDKTAAKQELLHALRSAGNSQTVSAALV